MAMVKAMATRRHCGVGHFRSKAFFQMKFASNHEKGNLIKAKSRNIKLIYGSEIACEKRHRARRERQRERERNVAPEMLRKQARQHRIESRVAKLRNFSGF